jgi:hypothetical protein
MLSRLGPCQNRERFTVTKACHPPKRRLVSTFPLSRHIRTRVRRHDPSVVPGAAVSTSRQYAGMPFQADS